MTTIISRGRVTEVRRDNLLARTIPSTGSIDLLRTAEQMSVSYEWVYRTQPFVYATINKLAKGAARNPLWVYEEDPDTQTLTRVRNHDLPRLLASPCPGMTLFRWTSAMFRGLYVHGHALAWKQRLNGPGSAIVAMHPVPWHMVRTSSDDLGVIRYGITINGAEYDIDPADVIHWRLVGEQSPLEPLARAIAIEDAAVLYQAYSMRNGVSPRAAFSAKGANQRGIDMLRAELAKLYAGPENGGQFIVAGTELDVKPLGITPADLGLMPMREFSRQEVLAALDVPPPLVGLLENATLANVAEYRKALHDAIRGDLEMAQQELQVQLVNVQPEWDGLIVEFNTDAWLLPDPEARAKMHMLTQQASTTTINERRRIEKLPPIDDPVADAVFLPTNMTPVGSDVTSDAGTPAQGIADRIVSDTLAE